MIRQMPVVVGLQNGGMRYIVQAVTVVRRNFGILRGMNALLGNMSCCQRQRISWQYH